MDDAIQKNELFTSYLAPWKRHLDIAFGCQLNLAPGMYRINCLWCIYLEGIYHNFNTRQIVVVFCRLGTIRNHISLIVLAVQT
jgi:hypothetical protein